MHQAYNRDDFIKVDKAAFNNESCENEFKIFPKDILDEMNIPYDYQSVTHYGIRGCAKENEFTIIPFDLRFKDSMGKFDKLSDIDVKKINIVYECQAVWDAETVFR